MREHLDDLTDTPWLPGGGRVADPDIFAEVNERGEILIVIDCPGQCHYHAGGVRLYGE